MGDGYVLITSIEGARKSALRVIELEEKLTETKALIEQLIEAGEVAQDLLDDGELRMYGEWHEGQMSQEKEWNALVAKCKAAQ